MNKLERSQKIRDILTELGQASVSQLSSTLGVSEATVRTDLEELERSGFLTRYHGGASYNKPQSAPSVVPYSMSMEYSRIREQVGITAANLIQAGDGVFLGPGTTNYYIALALRQRTDIVVNVVTNNFLVASAIRSCPSKRLHFIGGLVEPAGLFTIPDDIEKSLEDIYLDKMFFSIDGVDLFAGYTLSDPSVHNLITTVAGRSKQVIMAADSEKFDKRSFMKIGDLTFAPVVVSDAGIPAAYSNYYLQNGIRLYTE